MKRKMSHSLKTSFPTVQNTLTFEELNFQNVLAKHDWSMLNSTVQSGLHNVMIIDDSKDSTMIMQQFLRKSFNPKVHVVQDVFQAVEVFCLNAPELVILDILMPHINGIKLGKMINIISSVNTPILYVSSRRNFFQDLQCEYENSTAKWDFLLKPFDHAEFVKKVKKMVIKEV